MSKLLPALFIILFVFFTSPTKANAVYDPLSIPNNKFGIHILFPTELDEASKLVNSQGGDWGYVTIPLPETDYDIDKWQAFMDRANQLHLIPIIRLTTRPDPLNTSVWEKPNEFDLVDAANFLNSLTWPTENRYVIVYNEVNRGDEWGSSANPYDYANILSLAADIFHQKHSDFFVISAGLDNAAPNAPDSYINEYTFLSLMEFAVPGIFNKIDGIASHSYPNPGFTGTPKDFTNMSIHSFLFEKELIQSFSSKNHPIFITETGWDKEKVSEESQAEYYKVAFDTAWSDPKIVAVTPFILSAGTGAFPKFSFLTTGGDKTKVYSSYQLLPKIKGMPPLSSVEKPKRKTSKTLPLRDFSQSESDKIKQQKEATKNILKLLIGI